VLCAVFGPSEVRIAKELPHRAAVDVLFRHKTSGGGQSSGESFICLFVGVWFNKGLVVSDASLVERGVEHRLTSILESMIQLEDDLGAGFNVIIHEQEDHGGVTSD
jgi:hypothetical protein